MAGFPSAMSERDLATAIDCQCPEPTRHSGGHLDLGGRQSLLISTLNGGHVSGYASEHGVAVETWRHLA
jgi:hypothetical protein